MSVLYKVTKYVANNGMHCKKKLVCSWFKVALLACHSVCWCTSIWSGDVYCSWIMLTFCKID